MTSLLVEHSGRDLVVRSLKTGKSICVSDGAQILLTGIGSNVLLKDAVYPEYELEVPRDELFELLTEIQIKLDAFLRTARKGER